MLNFCYRDTAYSSFVDTTGYGEPERLAPFCILVRYNYPTVDGFFKMVAVGKKLLKK